MIELLVVTKVGHTNFGNVISAKTSPASWGREEDIRQWVRDGNDAKTFPGVFSIVKSGMNLSEVEAYLEPWREQVVDPETGDPIIEIKELRLYELELSRKDDVGAAIDSDGLIQLTKRQTRQLLRNKETLGTEA